MQSIGSALASVFYEIRHDKDQPGFLRGHPGDGASLVRSHWRIMHHPKFRRASMETITETVERIAAAYDIAQEWCESPIEREMLASLMSANWDECGDPAIPVIRPSDPIPADKPIVIMPQFQIGRCRLDFAILCRGLKSPSIIDVECDGADFHDRQKDAERDTYLRSLGVHVFRATGSVIRRAPEDISNTIVNLAQDRI